MLTTILPVADIDISVYTDFASEAIHFAIEPESLVYAAIFVYYLSFAVPFLFNPLSSVLTNL